MAGLHFMVDVMFPVSKSDTHFFQKVLHFCVRPLHTAVSDPAKDQHV